MKYVTLIFSGLRRKLLRTVLTGVSIFIAFMLLGVMTGVTAGFDEAIEKMNESRLRTISRANIH